MGLTRRFVFRAATIASLLILAAAHASRAQNSSPPTPAPPTTEIPDANKPPETTHGVHTVTVTFDYDFRQTPACSTKVPKNCVMQFIAYDISAGIKSATMLFPIALPTNPVGAIHGITATSPKLDFESGKHLISVSAMGPDGRHSRKSLCTTWITIP
jgi:hypothetical protein